jgi:hypothetical protein
MVMLEPTRILPPSPSSGVRFSMSSRPDAYALRLAKHPLSGGVMHSLRPPRSKSFTP